MPRSPRDRRVPRCTFLIEGGEREISFRDWLVEHLESPHPAGIRPLHISNVPIPSADNPASAGSRRSPGSMRRSPWGMPRVLPYRNCWRIGRTSSGPGEGGDAPHPGVEQGASAQELDPRRSDHDEEAEQAGGQEGRADQPGEEPAPAGAHPPRPDSPGGLDLGEGRAVFALRARGGAARPVGGAPPERRLCGQAAGRERVDLPPAHRLSLCENQVDRHAHQEDESGGGQGDGDGEERLLVRLGPGVQEVERWKGLADRDHEQDQEDIAHQEQSVEDACPDRQRGLDDWGSGLLRSRGDGDLASLDSRQGADEHHEDEVDRQPGSIPAMARVLL